MNCTPEVMDEIVHCKIPDKALDVWLNGTGWALIVKYLRERGDSYVMVASHPTIGMCIASKRNVDSELVLLYVEHLRNSDMEDPTPCFEVLQDQYLARREDTLQIINFLRLATGKSPIEKISDCLKVTDLDDDEDDEWPPPRRVA